MTEQATRSELRNREFERGRLMLGKIIPEEAVRHGWNIADLSYDEWTDRERWSVQAIGPVEVYTEERQFVGGKTTAMLMVLTGTHGRIEARTLDELARLVTEWVHAVWPTSTPVR